MRGGRLRNEATIEQNTPTRDAIGGEAASWSAYSASWWCELKSVPSIIRAEKLHGRTVHAQADWLAVGRYVAGVSSKMRLTLAGRTFDILNASDPEGRGRTLQLELLERNV